MTRFALPLTAASLLALTLAACSREAEAPPEPVEQVETEQAPPAPQIGYACESGRSVTVRYTDGATAEIEYEGQTYTMRIARSASGARYTGTGVEWWTATRGEQESATLSRLGPNEEVGSTVLERCTRPASSVLPPPGPGADANGAAPTLTVDPDGVPPCRGPALRLAREGGDAGAGNRGLVLSLTNTGTTPCAVTGHPRIRLLDADGDALDQIRAVEQPGTYFRAGEDPEPVALAPGAKAYFDIAYSAVPHENIGETTCPSAARIEARAPGDSAIIPLDLALRPCGRQIRVTPLRPVRDGERAD